MIPTVSLIIIVIVLKIKRRILRHGICHTTGKCIGSIFVIADSLCIHGFAFLITCICTVLGIKISLCIHPGHIIHSGSDCCLDSGINSRRIQSHAAPAADTDNSDSFRINIFLYRKEINCCLKIFRVNVR